MFELIALLTWSKFDSAETEEARRARWAEVVDAVSGFDRVTVSALLAIAEGETHLAAYTRGDCTGRVPKGGANCDGGRARSYWQLHRAACPELWVASDPDMVKVAARCAAKRWRWAYRLCERRVEEAMSAYGWGTCKLHPRSAAKEATMRRIYEVFQ